MSSGSRRLVKRLAGSLPPPHDEAMLNLLRSTRDLVRGRSLVNGPPVEDLFVHLGWQIVDAYERLGTQGAARVFRHELNAWYRYAKASVENLEPWEAGRTGLAVYEHDNNRLRFRRTIDFVMPEERVFDVGFGRGYLCGLLLRDRRVAAYHGIDVVPEYIEATRRMLAANDMENREVQLEICDLFELRQTKVALSRATLVICCEVLEHVADPEAALAALAEALPKGTDLLFSVPLHGRLESVWGHVTVFDVARLKAMIEGAQLFVHHVEPVANTWTMVVASRDRKPSRRVQQAKRRPLANPAEPLLEHYDFESVEPGAIEVSRRNLGTVCVLRRRGKSLVECHITGTDQGADDRQVGGVSFDVRGFTGGRIYLGFLDFGKVVRVDVEAFAGNRRLGQWVWNPISDQVAGRAGRRFAFRIGESSPPFTVEGFEESEGIDRIEVLAETEPGESAAFSIRAAYLPRM